MRHRRLGEVGTAIALLDWMSMRFTVRKATKGWMVWDTVKKRVAEVDERPAIGISEEAAVRVADMLNSQHDLADGPSNTRGTNDPSKSRG